MLEWSRCRRSASSRSLRKWGRASSARSGMGEASASPTSETLEVATTAANESSASAGTPVRPPVKSTSKRRQLDATLGRASRQPASRSLGCERLHHVGEVGDPMVVCD